MCIYTAHTCALSCAHKSVIAHRPQGRMHRLILAPFSLARSFSPLASCCPLSVQFYGYLSQQQNMMQDYVRTGTYQRAILQNHMDFKDKVLILTGLVGHRSFVIRVSSRRFSPPVSLSLSGGAGRGLRVWHPLLLCGSSGSAQGVRCGGQYHGTACRGTACTNINVCTHANINTNAYCM